ncbi:AmmeMemoRadiSam system protein B [Schaalia naturae]|uniref:AmmeMemoRadiSam system protein B n=1 Tax=Schaalia naturae TaxID=635203 RepID=A0ABW2SLI6_9ACTO
MTLSVRPPAVAGMFYPARAPEIVAEADRLLEAAERRLADMPDRPHPKALIVPHAGWMWSGDLAALGWQTLAPRAGGIGRVVLLGPTHRVAIRGAALPGVDLFATPAGALRIPADEVLEATTPLARPVGVDPLTHAEEHALEVQVPFIQRVLGDVDLVPLNVGLARPDEVADIIDALWDGSGTVVAVSSDLSHYHTSERAREVDRATIRQIVDLDGPIPADRACGASPLNGLLTCCARRGLRPRLLGAHNSGDVAGDHDRVVGYAALTVEETRS